MEHNKNNNWLTVKAGRVCARQQRLEAGEKEMAGPVVGHPRE
jgi:hypothetical protein